MKRYFCLLRFVCLFILIMARLSVHAQIHPLVACTVNGTSPVTQGNTYTYTLGGSCTTSGWTCTCGTIISSTSTAVTITFDRTDCFSSVITATGAASKTVTINPPPALGGGSITNPSQTINYNTIPTAISATSASGGGCTDGYNYQWYSSTDGTNFFTISGAMGQNYQPGSLTVTTWFERQTTCPIQSAYTSNVAEVTVYPAIVGGNANPSSQTINNNATPGLLSLSGLSGGNGTYSYQWQSAADVAFSSPINVGTNPTYLPPALTTTTYFRAIVNSNGGTPDTSTVASVIVLPALEPGSISPLSQTINYNTVASTMTIGDVSGGNGIYGYQWYSNASGSYLPIANDTAASYSPGVLSVTTSYYVQVTSNGASQTTPIVTVTVQPPPPQPGANLNYIRTRVFSKSSIIDTVTADGITNVSDVHQTTQYLDGLGRPVQMVAKQATPLLRDIVTVQVYDAFGRDTVDYLPYSSATPDGNFKPQAITEQNSFNTAQFPGEQYYAGRKTYESSPLNRVLATTAPGLNWSGAGRSVTTQYLNNTIADSVQIWNIADSNGSIPVTAGIYSPGTLVVMVITDEQQHQVVEYKDKLGKVILKKVQSADHPSTGPSGWLNTYYIYDDFENLRFVIQPQAVDQLLAAVNWNISPGMRDELCFYYSYDGRRRMIVKKVPGAGEVYMVYDVRDRLVMTEDFNQRRVNQWVVTQYDGQNRQVETGLITYASALANMQQMVTAQTAGDSGSVSLPIDTILVAPDETGDIRVTRSIEMDSGYSTLDHGVFTGEIVNGSWGDGGSVSNSNVIVMSPVPPGVTVQPLTFTYYDDYSWVAGTNTPLTSTFASGVAGNSNYFITSYNTSPVNAVPVASVATIRGLVTGSQSLVLGSNGQYLSSVNFYDDRGRLIQNQNINYSGGVDTLTTQYDFSGKPLRALLSQAKVTNTVQNHEVLTKTNYDPNFRVTSIWKNIDGAAADQLIDSMQYNEIGQLSVKYLGRDQSTGMALDSLVYDYNIRGWVTGINKNYVAGMANHYFGMELGYDNATSVAGTSYSNPAYNGNIAGTVWRSAGDGVDRKYDFTYDNVNRLTGAAYLDNRSGSGWNNTAMDYSVSGLTYDANGNILSMIQKGFKIGSPGNPIDSLTYRYVTNSNKLSQVFDGANDTASVLGDFHYKGAKQDSDYRYDGNGSLTLDNNKGIDTIIYNYLNLPQQVHMKGKGNILYTYDATGNKLQKQTIDSAAGLATTTLYLDGFQYQRRAPIANPGSGADTLQFVAHEEGRARWAFHKYLNGDSAYAWEYDFMERDHLGNTRVLLSQEKDTAQYMATMEARYRAMEDALFYGLDSTSYARKDVPGYPDDQTVPNPNDSVARVNGNGPKVGPAIILKVMAGDKVDLAVQYYYNSMIDDSSATLTPQNLLNSLASGLATLSVPAHGAFTSLSDPNSSPLLGVLTSSIGSQNGAGTSKPQAYLNWVLLDDQFNYVGGNSQSGALQVGAADTQSNGQLQPPLAYCGLPITKSGYLYIYVSNATPGWDVFFDNLSVKHYSGPLLEESHYYPYGLTMAGISDKAMKPDYTENKNRFNKGSELQNKEFSDGSGLEMYETTLRELDPQLGRWWQIDWKKPTDAESPYASMGNNPILHDDPLGDSTIPGAGFWANAWQGIKDGGKSTVNLVKSLGSAEGWKNLGHGVEEFGVQLQNGEAATQVGGYVKNIPNMTKDQLGHDLGYGAEKVGEAVVLSKGAGLVKNVATGAEVSEGANAVKTTTQIGNDIVGTAHNDILPTQDWINPNQVQKYETALKNGENVEPIRTYQAGDKTYIEDGHHRYVASQKTGISVPMIHANTSGPVGFPDWTKVIPQAQ